MSKGQYDTIQYVGQEVHRALRRLFQQRSYGEISISHRDSESNQESLLSYAVAGTEVHLTILKKEDGYHLMIQIGVKDSHNFETKSDRGLKFDRSGEGKLVERCMDDLALESLRCLREFHKSREPAH
ncbi:MAG: hypothetical protein AABX54_00920 [Nanoarchaeota archaeon]|mgnify:CR=1 FL=1